MTHSPAANLFDWDKFEVELAELGMGSSIPFSAAIGNLSRKYGRVSSEALLLASISFCANYDVMIGINDENTLLLSQRRYTTVAALAADISALARDSRTCSDLVRHWVATDDAVFS